MTLFGNNLNYTQEQVLAISAALESHSEHPIAKPFAEHRDFRVKASQVKVHSGQGVSGTVEEVEYAIGKMSSLAKHGALNKEHNNALQEAN